MKYQHKKSYIKPRENGCNMCWPCLWRTGTSKSWTTTHNIKCELRKYQFFNEDIDVTLLDVTERRIC